MIIYDAFEFRVKRARCMNINERSSLFPSRSFDMPPRLLISPAGLPLFDPSLTNTRDRGENNERVIMRTWKVCLPYTLQVTGTVFSTRSSSPLFAQLLLSRSIFLSLLAKAAKEFDSIALFSNLSTKIFQIGRLSLPLSFQATSIDKNWLWLEEN